MSGAFEAAGGWSIAFGAHEGIKFQAVTCGECWVALEGTDKAVRLMAGDCLLLPHGRPFRIASDLTLPPIDFSAFSGGVENGITSFNGGGEFMSIGGYFTLVGDHTSILLGLLPPIVHIRGESQTVLRWCLERLSIELRNPQPGGFLVAQQLASLMLVQSLRLHLADGTIAGVGWLSALANKHMNVAIQAMHASPSRRWTLQLLAEVAGMSRTAFALKFKATVGVSVMDYLTRWRMLLASDRIIHSEDSISSIAISSGYESESAFSTAFKRVVGVSPRQYSRQHQKESFRRACRSDSE
jgi:AraC-like DNA-binding protein